MTSNKNQKRENEWKELERLSMKTQERLNGLIDSYERWGTFGPFYWSLDENVQCDTL